MRGRMAQARDAGRRANARERAGAGAWARPHLRWEAPLVSGVPRAHIDYDPHIQYQISKLTTPPPQP